MEVIGVVAAIPELLKLVKRLGTAAGHLSNKNGIAKAAYGLRTQLELLSEVLQGVQQQESGKRDSDRLRPILDDMRKELEGLNLLVDRVEDAKNKGPNFFRRAQLVLTGFDSQLKARSQRIDRFTNLLQVYLAESAAQTRLETQLRKLLKPSMNTSHFIPQKLDGTLEWIWTHDTFRRWMGSAATPDAGGSISAGRAAEGLSDAHMRVLVLHGVNGCGKSVLAASVADKLRSRGVVTVMFSFWAGSSHDTRSDVMFKTIMWQLLEQSPKGQHTKFASHLVNNKAELGNVDAVITETGRLGVELGREIYVILDGIDESSDDWNNPRDGPLGGISKLLKSVPLLRVLLAGRQASLRMARRRWPLHLELTPELVRDDMNKLIQHELDNCPDIRDNDMKGCIQRELESRSTVMFLWVRLVFKELRLCFSEAEVHATLKRLPDQLNQEYHRLFILLSKRLHGRQTDPSVGMQRAKAILGLIIGAARPLTLTELQLAYAHSLGPDTTGSYHGGMISKEGIIDACGDIIALRGESVSLGHTSLREFLIRRVDEPNAGDAATADYFRLDAQSCQEVMALTCLRYLQSITWRIPGKERYPARELESRFPLLCYAISHMASHFLNSNISIHQMQDYARSLLQSKGEFDWLEFAVSMENDPKHYETLPANFWDETIQFGVSLDTFRPFASERDGSDPATREVHSTDTASSAAAGQMIRQGFLPTTTGSRSEIDTGLIRQLFLTDKSSGDSHLGLMLNSVQTCISRFQMLPNPVDIATQALEQTWRGMSFVALMALAESVKLTRPEQALKLTLLALEKVRDKGGLREAWAQAMAGNLQPEATLAAAHYEKSHKIVESLPPNPLFDCWSLNAATCWTTRLLAAYQIPEAKQAGVVVERLLATSEKGYSRRELHGQSTLRKHIYTTLENHSLFVKNRLARAVSAGYWFAERCVYENVERLLAPFAQDPQLLRLLDDTDAGTALHSLGTSAFLSGKPDRSTDFYRKERELLLSRAMGADAADQTIRDEVNSVTLCLARSLIAAGKSYLAEQEVRSVTSFSYLKDYWVQDGLELHITIYINLVHLIGQCSTSSKATVAGFLLGNMTHIEQAYIEEGSPKHDAWRFVSCRLLSHGMFDEAERYIRRILTNTNLPGHHVGSVGEARMREALAFSVRCQDPHPKRRDPYDDYLALLDYDSGTGRVVEEGEEEDDEEEDPWRVLRRQIGLGMHCATTGRGREAARVFSAVAEGYESIKCGADCIGELAGRFFRARAAAQETNIFDAILQLSMMVDQVEDRQYEENCCELCVEGYQADILLVSGYFHLAAIFDKRGMDPAAGDKFRDHAVARIKDSFSSLLDTSYIPSSASENGVGLFTTRWVRSCVSYVERRKAGEIAATVQAEEFPFETFLLPDTGGGSSRCFLPRCVNCAE